MVGGQNSRLDLTFLCVGSNGAEEQGDGGQWFHLKAKFPFREDGMS